MGVGPLKRAVFLDRDGVLNRAIVREGKPYPPASLEEMEIPAGTAQALHELKRHGYVLVVVTNQPDVARGTQSRQMIEAMHAHMGSLLPVDAFYVCFHDDREDCPCRKPKPGLLTMAAAGLGIDLAVSYMVGDRWRDVDAGHAAGCRTVWIDYGYRERGPSAPPEARVADLWEAVKYIVEQSEVGDASAHTG
jgi:D-glycero-D-manno-heptose 1,7-bisphosphate phosphatase